MKKIISPIVLFLIILILLNCRNESTTSEYTSVKKESHIENNHIGKDTVKYIFPNIDNNNCLQCHKGIEPIRDPKSGMMQEIYTLAKKTGYKDNDCIICHGGNPLGTTKNNAHKGTVDYLKKNNGAEMFYPDPASIWINDKTCGMCHKEQVSTQFTSLMLTEAGKIQGTTWGFGGLQGYEHNVSNIAVKELDYHQRLGTEVYKKYMEELKDAEPQVFPKEMKELPKAPTPEEVEKNPQLSVYTYLRTECQRCHIGVKGHNAYGDYRGTGCGSCHIPYSNNGLYEGKDPTIDKTKKGKLLVHSIQSSRDAPVSINGHSYTGIPTKTCTACHNRGRRIGVSYEGLMETSYTSPFMSDGDGQKKVHKKNYIHLKADLHLAKGMVCQDCHTSGDMHSLGDLSGAIQGAVEIECEDCHGTPKKYPWELPIGYGDEVVGTSPKRGEARGVSSTVDDYLKKGWVAPVKDGYLISSRGNPMPHIVKNGDEVILYSAGGKDIKLKPLKNLVDNDELSLKGKVAMTQIDSHIDKMECYTCHATWAPQCYGCHIKIDYSNPKMKLDWVATANNPLKNGLTLDNFSEKDLQGTLQYLISGTVKEQRSYLRWENPPLVVNGEHRISPGIPGCQTTVTVIGKDGKTKMLNHIFKIPHVEGAGAEGQLAIDIAPLHPHTVQKEARDCESCHNNPKSMGYGINGGKLYNDPSQNFVLDLSDANGVPIPKKIDTLFNAIPNLKMDWSRFIDEDGKQLQTVGHHFSGSRPLNKKELDKLDRRGVCMSCHKTVPNKDLASDLLSHVAKYAKVSIDSKEHSSILNKAIRISAWLQVTIPLFIAFLFILWIRKKRKENIS